MKMQVKVRIEQEIAEFAKLHNNGFIYVTLKERVLWSREEMTAAELDEHDAWVDYHMTLPEYDMTDEEYEAYRMDAAA